MRKLYCLIYCVALFLIVSSCSNNHKEPSKTEIFVLDQITGASGIVYNAKSIFIISDNSPYLYRLDNSLKIDEKIPIFDTTGFVDGEIAKKDKPDFESMEVIDNVIYVLGSGSKSPQRDILVKILLDNMSVKTISMTAFYNQLLKLPEMQDVELNLEGLAYFQDSIYLFNRMNNLIIIIDYNDFDNYIANGDSVCSFRTVKVKLPDIDGIESGFSGATICPLNQKLYFTSSVENTDDSYNDGEILGSFVGSVPMSKLHDAESYEFLHIDNNGEPIKAESICILSDQEDKGVSFGIVTDSDGGESLFIKLRFDKKVHP